MKRNLLILGLIAVLVAGFATAYLLLTPEDKRESMGMDEATDGGPTLPAVRGTPRARRSASCTPKPPRRRSRRC